MERQRTLADIKSEVYQGMGGRFLTREERQVIADEREVLQVLRLERVTGDESPPKWIMYTHYQNAPRRISFTANRFRDDFFTELAKQILGERPLCVRLVIKVSYSDHVIYDLEDVT